MAGIAVVGVLGGAGLAVAAPLAGGRGEGPHGDDRTAASGAASGSPDRTVASGSPSTGSPPASTLVIPDRLMLRPEDVPSGYALPYGVGYSSTTPSPWPAGIPCDALAASAYPSREAELVWRTVTFGEGSTREVRQTVVRYRPGGAQASIADLDAALPSCDERASMQRFPVVARDVAGDQSRLIRVEQVDSGEAVRYVAVVRVGAYVSTVEAVGGLRVSTSQASRWSSSTPTSPAASAYGSRTTGCSMRPAGGDRIVPGPARHLPACPVR